MVFLTLTEVFLTLVEVFLALIEVFLTLTEVFPCFFFICKANAKTGHSPHSSKLVVICVVRLLFVLFYVLFVYKCVLYYCHRATTQLQLINISYLCRSFKTVPCWELYWIECRKMNQIWPPPNTGLQFWNRLYRLAQYSHIFFPPKLWSPGFTYHAV